MAKQPTSRATPVKSIPWETALPALVRGAQALARAVAITHGPRGSLVLLDRPQGLLATRDGATVARAFLPYDPVEAVGAKALASTCLGVSARVGDGTTTTAALAIAMLTHGARLVTAGHAPRQLADEIRRAGGRAAAAVRLAARPVRDQAELARVLLACVAGDEPVADALAEACMAVGAEGAVIIEDGPRIDGVDLDFRDGLMLRFGYSSVGIAPRDLEGRESDGLDGPMVAVVRGRLWTFDQVRSILEEACAFAPRPLLLVAEGFDAAGLATIATNVRGGVLSCVPLAVPGPGFMAIETLRDIAALTGATLVDPVAGMDVERFDPSWLGALRGASIGPSRCTLSAYDDRQAGIEARAAELRSRSEATGSDHERDRLVQRAAALSGGLCLARVGGASDAERRERRGRVEDALRAASAALRGGVVAGGGQACLAAAKGLGDDLGAKLVSMALGAPTRSIASACGWDPDEVLAALEGHAGTLGWDAMSGRQRDLARDPAVLDAADVVAAAIEAAASLTANLLTTGAVLVPARTC